MQRAGVLENGDELYKATVVMDRITSAAPPIQTLWGSGHGQFHISAIDTAAQSSHKFPEMWGPEGGQFQIQAVDELSQESHHFPDIEFCDCPEYVP